jgi:hypothetical protein
MSVEIKRKGYVTIHPSEMLNGVIGEIVDADDRCNIGDIVQRINARNVDMLVVIGGDNNKCYMGCDDLPSSLRIRILAPGDSIEIT